MSTGALIMMITVQVTVASITGYLFYRVLTTKPKNDPEEDSYTDNDPES